MSIFAIMDKAEFSDGKVHLTKIKMDRVKIIAAIERIHMQLTIASLCTMFFFFFFFLYHCLTV